MRHPESMRITAVPLQPGLGALDYRVPEGMALAAGDVVAVPLGPRRLPAVVWDPGVFPAAAIPEDRLRPVAARLDVPPLDEPLRRLVAWVADYYLAAPGAVLRMALPRAAFAPVREAALLVRGPLPVDRAIRHPGRRALVERLRALTDPGPAPPAEWARRLGVAVPRVRALARAGLLAAAPTLAGGAPPGPLPPGPQLEPAQAEAAAALRKAVAARAFRPVLLDGVTGSGKTEVYFEAVAAALAAGGQVLVLLPEIALTEAWLARFRARFGFAPVLWHSAVPQGVRARAFRQLARAEAPVAVGARSALFLPLPRLALVVVDEAHDPSFKQEDHVPYHARDVAVMRARLSDCAVVLATATPALETLEQVRRGTYAHLVLPARHGARALPSVSLVDLRRHPPPRGRFLSPPVADAVGAALGRGEQALLFLNRRGYAPLTLCRACGARIACPNCTAWMVEHRLARRLLCHHCGHAMPVPPACPACGAEGSLVPVGPGVERLAEEVAALWPEARIALVTSDTLSGRAEAARLFAEIAAGRHNVLIGTQMLAKGHDFPGITLVAAVDADLGLEGGDLRAAERTFQQVTQVAGRAGRGARPGRVLVQTYRPEEPVMQAIASGDRARFLAAERAARAAAGMPPFGRLAALILSGADAEETEAAARALARAAPADPAVAVHGPAPAPLAMLRGRHRQRLLVHARRAGALNRFLRLWLEDARLPRGIRLQVDVDPQSFL